MKHIDYQGWFGKKKKKLLVKTDGFRDILI